MSKGNPFIALRLARNEEQALRARAQECGSTLSDFVRRAIVLYTSGDHDSAPKTRPGTQRPRVKSRPARLQRTIDELEALLSDYEAWQSSLPDSLKETATASLLDETVDALQQSLDLLSTISPPRGFGRD